VHHAVAVVAEVQDLEPQVLLARSALQNPSWRCDRAGVRLNKADTSPLHPLDREFSCGMKGLVFESQVKTYLDDAIKSGKSFESGLLIGTLGSETNTVLLSVPTPVEEDAKKGSLDKDWIKQHAALVGRMLCGGLSIVGMYLLHSASEKDSMDSLRKIVVAACAGSGTVEGDAEVFALFVSSKTSKFTCKTVQMGTASDKGPQPVELKTQDCSSLYRPIECNVSVDMVVPLSEKLSNKGIASADAAQSRLSAVKKAVMLRANQVVACVDRGIAVPVGKGKKSKNGFTELKLLLPGLGASCAMAGKQVTAAASMVIQGQLHCCGLIPTSAADTTGADALKEDFTRTLKTRLAIIFDDWEETLDEEGSLKDMLDEVPALSGGGVSLPRRVLAPWPGLKAGSAVQLTQYVSAEEEADGAEPSGEGETAYPGLHAERSAEILCLEATQVPAGSFWSRERAGDLPDVAKSVAASATAPTGVSFGSSGSKAVANTDGGNGSMLSMIIGFLVVAVAVIAGLAMQ
jgi:hypothetical protein